MTVLTNCINQPQFQHLRCSTSQMLSIQLGEGCVLFHVTDSKTGAEGWGSLHAPRRLCQLKAEQACPWQAGWIREEQPVALLLRWVYLLLGVLHKVEGLCCGAAKLGGSQTVQRLSNPRDVPEVPHSVANPAACSDCLNLILKKKKSPKIINNNNNYTLVTFASYSYFSVCCILFIGVDFKIKTVELRGKKIRLQIW